jgi:hypothetical protein
MLKIVPSDEKFRGVHSDKNLSHGTTKQSRRSRFLIFNWIKILLGGFIGFPISAIAISIFGPSSYEECLADGKIGRTDSEIAVQMKMCRKKFPILPNLSKNEVGQIKCTDTDDKTFIQFSIRGKKIIQDTGKGSFSITIKNSQFIRFEDERSEKSSGRKVKMYGEIDLQEGSMQIDVSYLDNKSYPIKYYLNCVEDSR